MKKSERPSFTFINYSLCNYCTHLVRAEHRDGYYFGCELIQNREGQYARVTPSDWEVMKIKEDGGDAINSEKGCDRFCASGLPAYPDIKQKLVRKNLLAESIPEDINALETSLGFAEKIDNFPHREVNLFNSRGKLSIQ